MQALEDARESLSDRSFVSIHSVGRQAGDIERAVEGHFRLGARTFALESPIDWAEGPYAESDAGAFFLNSFVFAEPILSDPRFEEALPALIRVFLDWLASNPMVDAPTHRYSWHDHAAAGRLVYLAFTLREAVRRRLVEGAKANALAVGVLDHVRYLVDDENYAANYNHGLFSDAALALAARSLASYGPAQRWAEIGSTRFREVLDGTVDREDALHLEHSPYYHWIIHGAISRFSEAGLFEELNLTGLVRRMEESGSWLVAPDGTLPPLGDTPFGAEPPSSVKRAAQSNSGMRVFSSAGYAAIRRGGSCLIVTAAYHPTAHKHSDDCSFCLYEGGLPLVLDAGDPGHDYQSADRRFGTSPAAHAAVSVDGFDWSRQGGRPHGSGISAAAEAEGLHAVLARNPTAASDGGRALRILVYSPGDFLVAIDQVEAGPRQTVRRHLPLAPDLEATVSLGGRVDLRRGGTPTASVIPFSVAGAAPEGVELFRGREAPEIEGVYYPKIGEPSPRCSLVFSALGGEPRALAIALSGRGIDSPTLSWAEKDGCAEIELKGLAERPIRLRAAGSTLELSRPAADTR